MKPSFQELTPLNLNSSKLKKSLFYSRHFSATKFRFFIHFGTVHREFPPGGTNYSKQKMDKKVFLEQKLTVRHAHLLKVANNFVKVTFSFLLSAGLTPKHY